MELLRTNTTCRSPDKGKYQCKRVLVYSTISLTTIITFLFHEEWGFHWSYWVVYKTHISTKGMGVICCYSDHKLFITRCGDDSAILDPWNTTGGRVATISWAIKRCVLIVLKSWSGWLDRNCSWFYRKIIIVNLVQLQMKWLSKLTHHSTAS